jgi:hypothetical protein
MRRVILVIMWGVLGAALAAALIDGAFVVVGTSLTDPASAVRVVGPPLRPVTSDRRETDPTPGSEEATPSVAPLGTTGGPSPASTGISRGPTADASGAPDDGGPERGDD